MKHLFQYILSLAVCAIFLSCSEEEEFTRDKSAHLTFSTDTIKFDTLFNTIPSATKRLIVYNHNDKGVMLSSVALKSGGTAGFRMNADGQHGTNLKNIEILAHDSIFIFLEALSKDNETNHLTHLEDNIIFSLESGIRQEVALECHSQKAKFLHHHFIDIDTKFDSSLPYVIYDSLVVGENSTLTIEAGAKLYFHNNADLIVRGKLIIKGELNNEVTIRGDRTDRLFTYLPYDRLDNQWGGIYLAPSCTGCIIEHADIHSGNYGVECDSIAGELEITNSTIHNVAGNALSIRYTKARVANSQLSNAYENCTLLTHSEVDFYHCTIAQFYPWAADRGNALFMVKYPDEQSKWKSAKSNFYNCIITGYAQDEVFADFDSKNDTLCLHFYSSLVNTDISDATYFSNCYDDSEENKTYREKHFKLLDTYAYNYDFRLDSISTAIGKASTIYSELYPCDKNGILRPQKSTDLGCYQTTN